MTDYRALLRLMLLRRYSLNGDIANETRIFAAGAKTNIDAGINQTFFSMREVKSWNFLR